MRERLVASLRKQRFDKDEHGHGSYKRGEGGTTSKDDASHTSDGKLPGFPHGTAASGTHQYTVLDHTGNEVSHHDSFSDAMDACHDCAGKTSGEASVRDNTGESGNANTGVVATQEPPSSHIYDSATKVAIGSNTERMDKQYIIDHPYSTIADMYSVSDRYAGLKARALSGLDANSGSLSSRCLSCGKDLSVRDMKAGGYCTDHARMADSMADSSPDPHKVPRPGGSITKPRPPMTKDGSQGKPVEMGGPGSGPQPGGGHGATGAPRVKVEKPKGLLAKIKGGLKAYGRAVVNQYHIPDRDKSAKSGGTFKTRNEQSGPEAGVDYIASRDSE